MWHDLGFFRGHRFHIHGVTGPDEYTALVDDNAYTNAMARMNLRFAADVVDRMRTAEPERYAVLASELGLREEEPAHWRVAGDAMYIPYDLELKITPQDHDFLSKEPWDFDGTPPSKYPLLLHFHPLVIYRYQVLKQADVVLADFLLGNEFSPELKRANFEYYDPITTGDSSLSACVQSIMATEIGLPGSARRHFQHALFMDLADLAGNTTDGVHMASAGGVWMAIVFGFGGLRDHNGVIRLNPRLPETWDDLRFRLRVRGRLLTIDIDHQRVSVEMAGEPLTIELFGQTHRLADGEKLVLETI
jgi:alpha,alpha-trehalose phosphorylase